MPHEPFFLGRWAEDRAETLLRAAGIEILGRNVRTRSGEIDIVGREGRVLVMVEVRLRRANIVMAWRSLGTSKRTILLRTAREVAARLGIPRSVAIRHDVVLADGAGRLVHLRGALRRPEP